MVSSKLSLIGVIHHRIKEYIMRESCVRNLVQLGLRTSMLIAQTFCLLARFVKRVAAHLVCSTVLHRQQPLFKSPPLRLSSIFALGKGVYDATPTCQPMPSCHRVGRIALCSLEVPYC